MIFSGHGLGGQRCAQVFDFWCFKRCRPECSAPRSQAAFGGIDTERLANRLQVRRRGRKSIAERGYYLIGGEVSIENPRLD